MVNLITRSLALITVLMAAALTPGVSGQSTAQLLHPTASHTQSQVSIGAGAHIQPLRPGFEFPRQTLRYEAEYHFWTAGVATLHIERTGNQEHVSGIADSTGVAALLFRVQDRFDSYFDAHSLCSSKLVKHAEEGSHWRDTVITFDYSRGKAVLEEKNLRNNQSKHTENDIPGCVTDVMSGILYAASLPSAAGRVVQFSAQRRR